MKHKTTFLALSLLLAFIIISKTTQAQDYYRLQNQNDNSYIHIETLNIENGHIDYQWHSAMWELEPVSGTSYFRIKNRWKNTYLNIENGVVECSEIDMEWHSAMWLIEPVSKTSYFVIQNRWKSTYLNTEDGNIKCSDIDYITASSMWKKEPINSTVYDEPENVEEIEEREESGITFSEWLSLSENNRPEISTQQFAVEPLSKNEADRNLKILYEAQKTLLKNKYQSQWDNRKIEYNDLTMPFYYKNWGTKPDDGYSLFISLHGGGHTTAAENDQQYENQKHLYDYTMMELEGVYLAVRAPNNDWDLWHQSHIDAFFNIIIQLATINEDINLNKVYILGYSAGGDGLYQLAPRMADRWAAAAMMAGHPGDASPLGLRNIGFTIHMGAIDKSYNRNGLAQEWKELLDNLQNNDPAGYQHDVQIHEGKGHWMDGNDKVALPWMHGFTRNSIPKKVVWVQDNVFHKQFYWLAVPEESIEEGGIIKVEYNKANNSINIIENYSNKLYINLNDYMLDLDSDVKVTYQGNTIFNDKVQRNISNLYESMLIKGDPNLAFSVCLIISNNSSVVVK